MLLFTAVMPFGSFCGETQITEWAPYSGISGLSSKDGAITFNSISAMPILTTRDNIFINASRFKFLKIRMKSNKSYDTGRMFFRRIGDAGFNYSNAFEFQTGLNNIFHGYLIDLGRNPNWFGSVTQVMLSPINSEGSVEIEKIEFLEPSMWLMARSFWQEFFIFEVPQLRTVNFIYGPKINGITVNLYIYYLIASLSMLVIAYEYIRSKDLSMTISNGSKKIFVICLFFWVILDLRVLFDQARTAVLDTQAFYGKSLEEKRAITTLGDFYGFLSLADSKIPTGSDFNILSPSYYYFKEKAVYYLYPRHLDDNAAYVLAYNPDRSQDKIINEYIKKGYRMSSMFKEGEILLKR